MTPTAVKATTATITLAIASLGPAAGKPGRAKPHHFPPGEQHERQQHQARDVGQLAGQPSRIAGLQGVIIQQHESQGRQRHRMHQ
jgi:hypothetical protein